MAVPQSYYDSLVTMLNEGHESTLNGAHSHLRR
jgi:hypothetical protein